MGTHHQITTPVIQKKSGAAVKLFGLVWDGSGAGEEDYIQNQNRGTGFLQCHLFKSKTESGDLQNKYS